MVWDVFKALSVHADWGVPQGGLVHDLLHFDDWGSREYDPIAWLLEHAGHDNAKHKWDPLAAALGIPPPNHR